MVHVTKKLNFPQSPFSINNVVKCIGNLLDGNFLMCIRINSSTENIVKKCVILIFMNFFYSNIYAYISVYT